MSETSIEPQSVAADKEPERKVRTFRVLRRFQDSADGVTVDVAWAEMKTTYDTVWAPAAADVGEQFGEGDYLLIERESDYSFNTVYPMRVVAEKRYRLADDDTA